MLMIQKKTINQHMLNTELKKKKRVEHSKSLLVPVSRSVALVSLYQLVHLVPALVGCPVLEPLRVVLGQQLQVENEVRVLSLFM